MPIYEYSCRQCHGHFQKLVQGFSDPPGLQCPRCGSLDLDRRVSRFATLKSEEARLESLADPATFTGLDETDPRSVAQWARKLGKELGEDAGEDWDDMVEEMLEAELSGEGSTGSGEGKGDDLGWG